jgi:hypothetical protein
VTVQVERRDWTVVVTYNHLTASPTALAMTIADTGFGVGPPQRLGRAGQILPIPPDVVS